MSDMIEMKTLTIQGQTFEVIDESARNTIGEIVLEEDISDAFDFFVGFLNKNGNPVAFNYGGVTDFIPVEIGDVFYWSGASDINGSCGVCEYDKNKNFIKGDPLATKSYTFTRNVKYTVTEGAFVRFSSMTELNEETLIKTKEYDGISELVNKTDEYTVGVESGYINKAGTFVATTEGANAIATQFIQAKENDVFLVSCNVEYAAVGVCFYDVSKTFIKAYLYNEDESTFVANKVKVIAPERTAFVRFSGLYTDTNPVKVWKYDQLSLVHTDYQLYEYTKELRNSNYLWGKKYVACGDSFTAGDFSEKNDETWDDRKGLYKTYAYHIAERNKMIFVNDGKSGSTMHNNGDSNAFSVTRYTQVPTDADYITLCFGLNETSATIGTLQDTTNETVIGAWNIVLEHLITNIPYAKIGIIIPDAWCSSAIREAMIDVAEYWGIPYLDLKGDPKIPMLIGGRIGYTASSRAIELRNSAFQISSDDSHPNAKAHLYRSTIIENFMRSL